MKTILITGGAGYIGLNVTIELISKGYKVIIVDDLKNSYAQHVYSLTKKYKSQISFFRGDVCDKCLLEKVFSQNNIDCVLHLAAKKYVSESLRKPEEYKKNNIKSLEVSLDLCQKYNVKKVAFASSSIVYGQDKGRPFDEKDECYALNPYAQTKCMGEQIINEWHEKTGIPSIVFRFTNPVGANTQYMIGDHSKTNQMQLIPYVVNCSINDKEIVLRGNNYNTLDGTPIRSYIHISDLAKSVVCALEKFDKNIEVYNIGNRKLELSTRQIVEAVSGVIGKEVKYTFVDSGKCENARIACNYDKFNNDFGYESVLGVEEIIKSQIAFDNFINEK